MTKMYPSNSYENAHQNKFAIQPRRLSDEEIDHMMTDDAAMKFIRYNETDVLSGRGGLANKHRGNILFRRLVDIRKDLYRELSDKRKKAALVQSIIRTMKEHGARFLKMDRKSKLWVEVSDKESFQKTSQALREPYRKCDESDSEVSSSCVSSSIKNPRITSRVPIFVRTSPPRLSKYSLRSSETKPITCQTDEDLEPIPLDHSLSMSTECKHFVSLLETASARGHANSGQELTPHNSTLDSISDNNIIASMDSTVVPPSLLHARSSALFPQELDELLLRGDSMDLQHLSTLNDVDHQQIFPL